MGRKDREEALAASPEPRQQRITPVDIQQKEFRLSFRGYSEREVDEFLDLVTEEVARLHAENRRLQEDVEFQRTVPIGTDSAIRADEIVRRAREEADRIVAEARARAAGGRAGSAARSAGGAAEAAAVGRFLGREREFLQSLAALIQRHAEAVKEDARSARRVPDAAGSPVEEPGEEPAREDEPALEAPPSEETSRQEQNTGETVPPRDLAGVEGRETQAASGEHEEGQAIGSPPEPPPAPESERDRWIDDEPESTTQAWTAPLVVDSPSTWAVGPEISAPEGTPSPPNLGSGPVAEEDPGEDRSLRELFWGED
ncbi:MAG TPA: DivIVA domain-containing protein [Actinomycetota bacterium]